MSNEITILEARSKIQTKIIKKGKKPKPIANETWFKAKSKSFQSINELSKYLTSIGKNPKLSIVRGKFKGYSYYNENESERHLYIGGYTRRKTEFFEDIPSVFMTLDIDNYVSEKYCPIKEPVKCINEYIAKELPDCFWEVSYHWQLSSSAGIGENKNKLNAHLTFILQKPYTSTDLRSWAKNINLNCDHSIFGAVKLVFTANPIFKGCDDPIKIRSGLEVGMSDKVNLVIDNSLLRNDEEVDEPKSILDDDLLLKKKDQIEKLLEPIPASIERPHWLNIGLAIFNELGDTKEAFDLFHNWSKDGGDKYQGKKDVLRTWKSFNSNYKGKKVRIGTVKKLAYENGYQEDVSHLFENEDENDDNFERRFKLVQAEEFSKNYHSNWAIKNFLPEKGLAVVYGASGSGKTFFVLDFCIQLSLGQDWRSHKVRETKKVCYIAAEGVIGVKKRLKANSVSREASLKDLELYILSDSPNLNSDNDDKELIESIKQQGGVDIIVIDTLAQASPGANENSGEDMGKILHRCQNLINKLDCLVLLVHHSGKDEGRGARGWSGLKAAADTEIHVMKKKSSMYAEVTKQKDGESGMKYPFALESINIDFDEDEEPITSCIVKHIKDLIDDFDEVKLGPLEKSILSCFDENDKEQTIEESKLIEETSKIYKYNGKSPESKSVKRSLNNLKSKGLLTLTDDNSYKVTESHCVTFKDM